MNSTSDDHPGAWADASLDPWDIWYRIIGITVVCAAVVAGGWYLVEPDHHEHPGFELEESEPLTVEAIMVPEALPQQGHGHVFGIAPADTEVTLFEERSKFTHAQLDLHRLDTSVHDEGGEQHLFSLRLPADEQVGEERRDFLLRVEGEVDGEAMTRWHDLSRGSTTDVLPVGADVDPPDHVVSEQWGENHSWHFESWPTEADAAPPRLTPKVIGNTVSGANRVEYVEDIRLRIADAPAQLFWWPIEYHRGDGGSWLTVATVMLRAQNNFFDEDSDVEVVRDPDIDIATNDPAVRAAETDRWSDETTVESDPHGVGTFEYRLENTESEPWSHPLEIHVTPPDEERQVKSASVPILHPALFVEPSVVTPDVESVSITIPQHKTPSVQLEVSVSEQLESGVERLPNPLKNPPRMTLLQYNHQSVDRLEEPDSTDDSLQIDLDAPESEEGVIHVMSLNDRVRAGRTLTAVGSADDVLDESLFAEGVDRDAGDARRAMDVLWGYLLDQQRTSGHDKPEVATIESADATTSRLFAQSRIYDDRLHRRSAYKFEQRDHVTSLAGLAGFLLLAVTFAFVLAGAYRMTPWRRRLDTRQFPTASITVGGALLWGLVAAGLWLAIDNDGLLEFGEEGATYARYLLAAIPVGGAAIVARLKPLNAHTEWWWRHLVVAPMAAVVAWGASLHSRWAMIAVLAVLGLVTAVSLLQTSLDIGADAGQERTGEHRRLLAFFAAGYALLPFAAAWLVLVGGWLN